MTAHVIQRRLSSQQTSTSPSPVKAVKAARPVPGSTDGLGAKRCDFQLFLKMNSIDQARQIREGMQAIIISRIANELLSMPLQSLLTSLRLPSSTINRKITAGERLSASESDRAARTVLIYSQAKDVLEDAKLAAEWLKRPHIELRDQTPLDMLDTQTGYDRVRDILVRLEHGVGV